MVFTNVALPPLQMKDLGIDNNRRFHLCYVVRAGSAETRDKLVPGENEPFGSSLLMHLPRHTEPHEIKQRKVK